MWRVCCSANQAFQHLDHICFFSCIMKATLHTEIHSTSSYCHDSPQAGGAANINPPPAIPQNFG